MQCGHEGCNCQVGEAGEFCSDHCREHAGDAGHQTHACGCGHADCQAAGADDRTEQDLQAAFE